MCRTNWVRPALDVYSGPHWLGAMLLLCFGTASVLAADTTAEKPPITIEANTAKLDDKLGVSVYTGNVIIVQGNMTLKADQVTVHSSKEHIDKMIAVGEPVRFHQSSQTQDPDIDGEALTVEYYAEPERLILIEKALLIQGANKLSGNRIEYDKTANVVKGAVAPDGSERVRVTIQPAPKKPQPDKGHTPPQAPTP